MLYIEDFIKMNYMELSSEIRNVITRSKFEEIKRILKDRQGVMIFAKDHVERDNRGLYKINKIPLSYRGNEVYQYMTYEDFPPDVGKENIVIMNLWG